MKKLELSLTAAQVPLDAILLFLAGLSAYSLRFTPWATGLRRVMFSLTFPEYVRILFLAVPVWIIIFAANGLYSTDPNRKFTGEINRIFFASTVGLAALTVYIFFRGELFDSRFIVIASWVFAIFYVVAGHLLTRLVKTIFYRYGIGTRHTILLGTGPVATRIAEILRSQPALGYAVIGHYPIFNEKVRQEILQLDKKHEVDEILISNPKADREETITILTFAEEHQFVLKYTADLFSTLAPNMRVSTVADVPLIEFRRARLDGWGKILKRGFDLIISAICLIILSPILAAAAIAVNAETGRPILFRNKRVGYRGKFFATLKFRSMWQKDCVDEKNPAAMRREQELIARQNTKKGPVYKIADDPRVTRVGKFLRRWSIDELPQLWNVFIGQMSLVGPRPHQPREVAKYSAEDRRVHAVKPGITGLAQISGRSDLPFEEEIRLDTFYIENWSLIMDLFILCKTPWAVLRRRKVE